MTEVGEREVISQHPILANPFSTSFAKKAEEGNNTPLHFTALPTIIIVQPECILNHKSKYGIKNFLLGFFLNTCMFHQ